MIKKLSAFESFLFARNAKFFGIQMIRIGSINTGFLEENIRADPFYLCHPCSENIAMPKALLKLQDIEFLKRYEEY